MFLAETVFVDMAPKLPYVFGALFQRDINPVKTKSFFLFGPRQTGKSTFAKSLLTPGDLYIDLLPQRSFLRSYSETYLKEEVAAEGLVRDIGPFAQFLDIAAANDGETVNANNIARECAVSAKTVQQYYQILEDTFLAVKLPAWTRSARRRLVAGPRYYFFDTGVTNALTHTLTHEMNPNMRGRRFEQFVVNQMAAAIHYSRHDYTLHYWRTNHGAEVDLLVCQGRRILFAVEIKSSRHISMESLTGLRSFMQDNPDVPAYILGIDQKRRKPADGLTVMDWKDFILEFPG